MKHALTTSARRKEAFGLAPARPAEPEARRVRRDEESAASLMRRRLNQKIDAYEREAKRLAFRGDLDAAREMKAAAARLRRITRNDAIEIPAS